MAALLFGVLALVVLYWLRMRRWFARWGATASDLTRIMAGDAAVVDPSYSATMAITIAEQAESRIASSVLAPEPFAEILSPSATENKPAGLNGITSTDRPAA